MQYHCTDHLLHLQHEQVVGSQFVAELMKCSVDLPGSSQVKKTKPDLYISIIPISTNSKTICTIVFLPANILLSHSCQSFCTKNSPNTQIYFSCSFLAFRFVHALIIDVKSIHSFSFQYHIANSWYLAYFEMDHFGALDHCPFYYGCERSH